MEDETRRSRNGFEQRPGHPEEGALPRKDRPQMRLIGG